MTLGPLELLIIAVLVLVIVTTIVRALLRRR